MNNLETINVNLHALVVFRHLLDDPVVKRLSALLSCGGETPVLQVKAYSSFVSALWREGGDLTAYVLSRVLEDENIYVQKKAKAQPIGGKLEECVGKELDTLQAVSRLTAKEVQASMTYQGYLPGWETSGSDFAAAYRERMARIATTGYGIFAKYHMFTVIDGDINPHPLARPYPAH